jgi:uncharacterized membrane protein HdeD (DUF308 family)
MKLFQSSIFRAMCAIIVGVLILKFPQDGVTWLTIAIGVLFLLSGIIALIAYWHARRHAGEYTITDQKGRIISGSQPTFPIVGLGSVILGLVLALTPAAFINGLMYVIGAILILGAITQLMALVAARRLGSVPFVFWICPSLVMLIGLFVMLKPHESAELPLIILGWCSLLYGVTEIINSLKIWSIQKEADKHVQQASLAEAEEISSHVGDDTLDVSLKDVDTRSVVPSPGND